MNVVVDGLMTNYQKIGQGKRTLVFLHGWGDTSKTFSKIVEQLQGEYIIVAVDLPGFGATQAPENAWGLEDYAKFIDHFLNKISIGPIYGLIGHSFGGAVSVIGASSGILAPKKIILISASGIRDQRTLLKRLMWTGAKIAKLPLYLLPANKAEKIKIAIYGKSGSDILLLPHMRLTFSRIIKEDVQSAASSIKVPTMLIYGTKDRETPVLYGQLLSKSISGSSLEIIDGAGHFVHQEQSDKVSVLIKDFLK